MTVRWSFILQATWKGQQPAGGMHILLHMLHPSSHGARPDRHCSGGGEERGIQVGCINMDPALMQPI
jgi:hypothetical protein